MTYVFVKKFSLFSFLAQIQISTAFTPTLLASWLTGLSQFTQKNS
jgi:hypothetical protein